MITAEHEQDLRIHGLTYFFQGSGVDPNCSPFDDGTTPYKDTLTREQLDALPSFQDIREAYRLTIKEVATRKQSLLSELASIESVPGVNPEYLQEQTLLKMDEFEALAKTIIPLAARMSIFLERYIAQERGPSPSAERYGHIVTDLYETRDHKISSSTMLAHLPEKTLKAFNITVAPQNG